MGETTFPTDDVTLHMLEAACAADLEDGMSHLHEFLSFGGEGYHHNDVILALISEVRALRTQRGAS